MSRAKNARPRTERRGVMTSLIALGAVLFTAALGAYGLLVLVLLPADDDDIDTEA